ncbi:uncharacterized protein [Epargyreus clarus]|uniref:uncharacterized protein n=1 Tax=Epargyreus clarus TaxID=520877 RepID=UPI003C2C85B4
MAKTQWFEGMEAFLKERYPNVLESYINSSMPLSPQHPSSPSPPASPQVAPMDEDEPRTSDSEASAKAFSDATTSSDSDSEGFQPVMGRKKRKAKAASTPPPSKKPSVPEVSDPSPASEPQTSGQVRPKSLPPPIFVRDKSKWDSLMCVLNTQNISLVSARSTPHAIKVQVTSEQDHRRLTRVLSSQSIGYHTYALEDEKMLRVVIRGVPKELELEVISNDLKSQGLPVKEVFRMYGRTRQPYDMVLVVLPKSIEAKKIFAIKTVCLLSGIAIEAPHTRIGPSQCHRCQLYGHSARNCFARPRCVKCLGDHSTPDCPRPKDCPDPPSCVLCETEGHPASYRGCPRAPPKAFPVLAAPVPNAWVKPPSIVAKKAPETTRPQPAAVTPKPPVAQNSNPSVARKPNPVPQNQPTLVAEDFQTIGAFMQAIDFGELKLLATKLRAANSPHEMMFAACEHYSLLDAMWRSKSSFK